MINTVTCHNGLAFATHIHALSPFAFPIMASVGSVARQIAALDISAPYCPPAPTASSLARPIHTKQASQPNVAKLLTKFAAPNSQQSYANLSDLPPPPTSRSGTTQPVIDIGRYDGGLETENEKRGTVVTGEAAEDLALDSSLSQCVAIWLDDTSFIVSIVHIRPKSGHCTPLI